MATRIQHRSNRGLKLGHSYQTYNIDICHTDTNLSIAMTIQMWIHARYTKLHRNQGKINERFRQIPRVFISSSKKYNYIHVIEDSKLDITT